ncbi:MAG TPA: glycosyltransferase family 4 protein [Patescibacteria group bacterium]|nr:glycosyltransferase family 4 protein [Patescibacteria group bacterium]
MKIFSNHYLSAKAKKKIKNRILVLYDFPLKGGGSGAYVKDLSLRLQERGYEVAVALPDKAIIHQDIKQFKLNLPQIPVFIGRPGLEKSKKYSEMNADEITALYTAYMNQTIKIIQVYKPDLIHVHHLLINAWVADFIRGLYGIRYVVTSHGSDLYVVGKDRRYFRKTREALRAADAITVVSADTREKLLRMFGKELAHKTRTIPGGIRKDKFPEKLKEEELSNIRRKYNLKGDGIVLFTGRLIDEKGVEYLVKAASRIKGQIVIAGDGPQKKKLHEMVQKMKLDNVHITGYIDHDTLIKLYYVADVFVAPSVWDDPMPLTIIEAMAAKLPVVVTRRGGISTAVKDGSTGFFVKTRNASDIAMKVNRLLADKVLRRKVGERARSEVLRKFTWKKIAERFDSIYSKI